MNENRCRSGGRLPGLIPRFPSLSLPPSLPAGIAGSPGSILKDRRFRALDPQPVNPSPDRHTHTHTHTLTAAEVKDNVRIDPDPSHRSSERSRSTPRPTEDSAGRFGRHVQEALRDSFRITPDQDLAHARSLPRRCQ